MNNDSVGPSGGITFKDAAPMALDRTVGWRYFAERGDVYEIDGEWYLTSLEAVRFAHQHPEIFSSARAFDSLGSPVPLVPLAIDAPDHVRYRRILDPMFAPRVINQIEDSLRAQVGELIDSFLDKGSVDLMAELAVPYPSQVIMTLLGLPLEDRDQFLAWNQAILETEGATLGNPTEQQATAAMALFGYLQGFIDAKRTSPGDDLISSIVTLQGDDAWTDAELLGMCFLFVLAGLDTVTASIGFVMMYLANDPELRQRIIEQPELTQPFIEEVLRLEMPAPMTPRVTTREVEVCGKTIPEGAYCSLVLATVNRGPDRGDAANSIDFDHADRGHLTFGGGIHRCLGSHLARRELRLVVEEFNKRVGDMSLAEGHVPEIVWPSGTLHFRTLPITFARRGA